MRANQFIENYDEEMIDEGLKQTMRNLGIAGVIGAGAALGLKTTGALDNYINKQPGAATQTQAAPAAAATALKKVIPIYNNHLETVLYDTAVKYGLKGAELAQFMAQCAHETFDFGHLKEIGNLKRFKKYDPKFNPQLAKVLGNKYAGDGIKFKGRGFIQLTGRDNYTRAGKALGLPLDKKPEMVEDPKIAALVSVWYWKNHVKPNVSNFNDTKSVTKIINPGLYGLADRTENFKQYLAAAAHAK